MNSCSSPTEEYEQNALTDVVESRATVVTGSAPGTSDDGYFPVGMQREYEEKLLALCASRTLKPEHWVASGPPFFMAGLAVMLASVDGLDRKALLALAERLYPGASETAVFA